MRNNPAICVSVTLGNFIYCKLNMEISGNILKSVRIVLIKFSLDLGNIGVRGFGFAFGKGIVSCE